MPITIGNPRIKIAIKGLGSSAIDVFETVPQPETGIPKIFFLDFALLLVSLLVDSIATRLTGQEPTWVR